MSEEIIQKYWRLIEEYHDASAFAVLDSGYREPHRGYHALPHIVVLLRGLDRFAHLASRPDLIAAAIFWHDAVYKTRDEAGEPRPDALNVTDSAALFDAHAKFAPMDMQAVREMILATRDHIAATATLEIYPGFTSDFDLFLDLDLSTLGASWSDFEDNLKMIRFEYAWVAEEAFCRAQLAMLEHFQGDARLYRRKETQALWLDAARANLARGSEELRQRLWRLQASANFG